MKKFALIIILSTSFFAQAKEEKGASSCPYRNKTGLFQKTNPTSSGSKHLSYDPARGANTAK